MLLLVRLILTDPHFGRALRIRIPIEANANLESVSVVLYNWIYITGFIQLCGFGSAQICVMGDLSTGFIQFCAAGAVPGLPILGFVAPATNL